VRENRTHGSEGGVTQTNALSLPLSPGQCDRIRSYAERLVSDGVDVLLDQWDLSEGQDKFVFMEKMVCDPSVSHVIIFSDGDYAQKADARKAGVGTESQIISKNIYERVDQKKFIPFVCERQNDDEPYLPTFLKSRIWIDFSTAEKVNETESNKSYCGSHQGTGLAERFAIRRDYASRTCSIAGGKFFRRPSVVSTHVSVFWAWTRTLSFICTGSSAQRF